MMSLSVFSLVQKLSPSKIKALSYKFGTPRGRRILGPSRDLTIEVPSAHC